MWVLKHPGTDRYKEQPILKYQLEWATRVRNDTRTSKNRVRIRIRFNWGHVQGILEDKFAYFRMVLKGNTAVVLEELRKIPLVFDESVLIPQVRSTSGIKTLSSNTRGIFP